MKQHFLPLLSGLLIVAPAIPLNAQKINLVN